MTSASLTEAERIALRDPRVRQGANLEAEYRDRTRKATGHDGLLSYIESLARAQGSDYSSADLAAQGAWVFVAGPGSLRRRLRLARLVLVGR